MPSIQEMEGQSTEQKYCPAYVSFGTLKNFVETLNKNGIPTKVNKSVMTHLSGGMQSHLMSALKALGLIEGDGEPTSALHELVDAYGTDDWRDTLRKVLDAAYGKIVGNLDLSKASPQELEKRFQVGGADGSMNDKAVRFYLAACKESKTEVSEYLKKRRGRPSKSKSRSTKASNGAGDLVHDELKPTITKPIVPDGSIEYPIHLRSGRKAILIVPSDLTEGECKMIELTLPLVKAYAEQQTPPPPRIEHKAKKVDDVSDDRTE